MSRARDYCIVHAEQWLVIECKLSLQIDSVHCEKGWMCMLDEDEEVSSFLHRSAFFETGSCLKPLPVYISLL